MEFQEIEIRGIKLKVWYTAYKKIFDWEEVENENRIDINSIQLSDTELYDFCEWYHILPDIYDKLWKRV